MTPTAIRAARPGDAPAIAAIWNEGIASREATFETRPREPGEILSRLGDRLPLLVAELDGSVVAFASLSPYSPRPAYDGVAEATVYVTEAARGQGIGTSLIEAVASRGERIGLHKLLGKLFTTNEASMRLIARTGFRQVGIHERHAKLEGEWRDVLLVERLIGQGLRTKA